MNAEIEPFPINILRPKEAKRSDVFQITSLINHFADQGYLVRVNSFDVLSNINNFVVVKRFSQLVGCGQLAIYRQDLAELRSVCVKEEWQRQGIGTLIVESLMQKAKLLGITHVMVITKAPRFWEKMGFGNQVGESRIKMIKI